MAKKKAASRNATAKRQRSPNYPAVGLRNALERVEKLYRKDGRAGAPLAMAIKHIGFSGGHGQAMTVLSALRKFGLIEQKSGRVIPSKRAMDAIEFGEGHQRRIDALRVAALQPVIYEELVNEYREAGELPSNESLKPELITDKGFNPKAVDGFLVDFKDSLEFAGLLEGNSLLLSGVPNHEPEEGPENEMVEQPKASIAPIKPCPPGIRELTFPLIGGVAVLRVPEAMGQENFDILQSLIEASKKALVGQPE